MAVSVIESSKSRFGRILKTVEYFSGQTFPHANRLKHIKLQNKRRSKQKLKTLQKFKKLPQKEFPRLLRK